LIKINLVREGRAVRGAGAAPQAAVSTAAGGPIASNVNNVLVVVFLLIGLVLAGGYWLWEKRELKQRQDIVADRRVESQKLESVIKEVDEYQKQKNNLQQRIDLINKLKQNQKGPVRIMDQISRDLPDLVWLDSADITAGRISLAGRGLNPNAIALFIENVKNDPYFEEPQVGKLTQVPGAQPVYTFDMNFAFSYLPKNAAGAAGAPATTASATATATETR
jgi:type IV pilus assembly protein PilN